MKTARLLQEAPTALAFILCLFGEQLAFSAPDSISSTCREVEALFRDPETQWMAVVCVGTHLVAFSVIRNRGLWGGMTRSGGVDLCRGAVLVISALVYFLNYRHASQSVQTVMLLGGAALGSAAWVNVFWRDELGPNKRSLWRFMALAGVMLAIASFWKSGNGPSFSYKHNARWMGPWDNSNLYGLLLASGMVLAMGLARSDAGMPTASSSRWTFWNRLKSALFLVVAAMVCFGLWMSFSRGAWLAGGVSGLYLLVQWRNRCPNESTDWIRWRRAGAGLAAVLAALLLVLFCQCQHTENATAHRVISGSNQNDLSWRNRVAAWEGALQMMAERPWLGSGWNQPESLFGQYYSASKLDETAAIQMNDYLILGATLGIPALFCFCMYLWLSLFPRGSGQWPVVSGQKEADQAMRELDWLKTVCRAGALVLAVGYWFDGGLFNLPTAATFWILLELGREEAQENAGLKRLKQEVTEETEG